MRPLVSGSGAVVVALVDTGCDLTHPDLRDKYWVNPGEIPANGIDDDGNGQGERRGSWTTAGVGHERSESGPHVSHGFSCSATAVLWHAPVLCTAAPRGGCPRRLKHCPAGLALLCAGPTVSTGYIDDVYGYDFAGNCDSDWRTTGQPGCGPQPSPQDVHSHGTHLA